MCRYTIIAIYNTKYTMYDCTVHSIKYLNNFHAMLNFNFVYGINAISKREV